MCGYFISVELLKVSARNIERDEEDEQAVKR